MYFSRIRLREGLSGRQMASLVQANEYRIHQWLWKLFPETGDKKRPFIYRREMQSPPVIYALSSVEPHGSELWAVETKPYDPQISEGDRLAFSLRVNPVQAKRTAEGKQQRHDVVMEAKKALERQGVEKAGRPSAAELEREHGWRWLEARMEKYGFRVQTQALRVEGYRQHYLHKRGSKPIQYSSMDFVGLLEITDEERFRNALFTGIGHAKAFGCGLMMVRRL